MNKAVLFILGLVVGVAAGFLWRKSSCDDLAKRLQQVEQEAQRCAAELEQAKPLLATARVVYVGPTSKDVNPDPLTIDSTYVVYWKPWASGHTVNVVFDASGFPAEAQGEPPFVNGKPSTSQPISCGGETCFSYDVNPNLIPILKSHPNGLTYKYSQSVDKQAPVDGRIIIKGGP